MIVRRSGNSANKERTAKTKRLRGYRVTLLFAGLALFSIGCATLVLAAPHYKTAGNISVSPDRAYNGDPIEISLKGFPGDYPVPAGAVTLAGVRIPIPGVFETPGKRPRTDIAGDVTFTARIPADVPHGPQTLTVTHFTGDGQLTTPITVLAADVSFSPHDASPNQAVVLQGSGFSPFTNPGGAGALGTHQITGEGGSGIMVNGTLLNSPHVIYPINLDTDGGLTANVTLPRSYISFPAGTLEVRIIDDAGRSGAGLWLISPRRAEGEAK